MSHSEETILKYQWMIGMQAIQLAEVEIAKVMYWCKSPKDEMEPDLVGLLALWTKADDAMQRIGDAELILDAEFMSVKDIRNKLAELEGFMIASEDFQPVLYQDTVVKQLDEHITKYGDLVAKAQLGLFDEDEWDDLLDYRDTLDYARMGINLIKLQDGLPKVNYFRFDKGLQDIDVSLKKALSQVSNIEIPIYAPSTAWWRQ